MARSRQAFSTRSFARGGMAVALAATLAVGSVPAMALVQANAGMPGAPIALAAEEGSGMEVGTSYTVPVSWQGSAELGGMASIAQSMLQRYFGSQVQVSLNAEGTYNVVISFAEYSDAVQQIVIGDQSVQQSADHTYTLTVDSLDEPISASLFIGGKMAGMFPDGVPFTMMIDTSSLPAEEPEPPATTVDKTALVAAIEQAKAVSQGDKTDEAWAALQDAIATAERAASNENIPQMGVDAVLAQLNAAVEAFNASEGSGTEAPEVQTVSVSYFVKDSGNAFSGMLPAEVQATASAEGGYDIAIPVAASTITMVSGTFWVKDATGADAAVVENEDGSRTYTLHVADITGAVEFSIGYTAPMGPGVSMSHNMIMRFFDCSAITAALDAAGEIADDGSDVYMQLQDAVEQAKLMVMAPDATQQDLETAASQLNAAVEAFNAASEQPGEGDGEQTAVETPGGFLLVPGQAYDVPVSVIKDDGSASMAADFFNPTGSVTWTGDAYQVEFSVTSEGQGYIESIEGIESLGGGVYRATVDSLTDLVTLTFALQTPMGAMTQTGYLSVDTSELPTVSGEPVEPEAPSAVTPTNPNPPATTQGGQEESSARFQAGHTYQVPMDFLKHNSSEVSMADQYFGDTALVRVSDDGTMLEVSFSATDEGMTHIISLAYNGVTLTPNGNQFTVTIPYTESDTVLPIVMTIKEMQELGGGPQTADLHLYLSQSSDLGTGKDGLTASATHSLPQTGDATAAVAGAAGVAAVAAVAAIAGTQARRRIMRRK